MVLRGSAHDALLDTYESEREPHVRAFIALAVKLGGVIQTTDPALAAERDRKFQTGSPGIFQFPAPRLGPGVRVDSGPPAGQPFPQPRLADGRMLDEATGQRFVAIATRELLAASDATTRARWQQANAVLIDDTHPTIAAWLKQHGKRAALLRPDHYIVGTADNLAELALLTARLPLAA